MKRIRYGAADGVEFPPSSKSGEGMGHPRYRELGRAGKVGHPPLRILDFLLEMALYNTKPYAR
jgi:hypothetical protein